MADDLQTPSAEGLIERAKSLGGGQFVPPPEMASQMAEDLKAIASRQKGPEPKIGGTTATAQNTKQAVRTADDLLPIFAALEESGDTAVSPKGAMGKYQIMPKTAEGLGFQPADMKIPVKNEKAARNLLTQLISRYGDDTQAIAIAYNARPAVADKWLSKGRDNSILPEETQKYLKKLDKITTPKEVAKPDNSALMAEAYRRNLLPSDKRSLYEEAVRRGLVKGTLEAPQDDAFRSVDKIKDEVSQAARTARKMAPDVDYDTGASWQAKVAIEAADNQAEAAKALSGLYGTGNYTDDLKNGRIGQDQAGRWWVTIKDKKIAVFGGGLGFGTQLARIGATLQATSPETAGMMIGGAIGAAGGPLDPVTIPLGAAIGGATGKGLDELRKWLFGIHAKSPKEAAIKMGEAAVGGATAEIGGRIASKAGGAAMRFLREKYAEVTPEIQALVRSYVNPSTGKLSAIPPPVTYAPGAKALQYDVFLRDAVKGDPQQAKNVKFAMQRLHDLLVQAGVPDHEVEDVFLSIIDPRRQVSITREAQAVTDAVKRHIDTLDQEARASLQTAKQIANRQGEELARIGRTDLPDSVHQVFVDAAQADRKRWGASMTRLYDLVDEVAGGKKIIPTKLMKEAVQPIVDMLPATGQPTIFHEIANLPNNITIKEAQRFRTRLDEAAFSKNLTPGAIEHDYSTVAASVGTTLNPDARVAFLGNAPKALQLLKEADAAYSRGIQKYKDLKLNQLIRDARTGKLLDVEAFAESLFDAQSTARVNTIRQVVGEDVWKQIQVADTRNLLREARRLEGDPTSRNTVSGDALQRVFRSRGPMMDAIHGPEVAQQWRTYADMLSALDGKIAPEILRIPAPDFSTVLAQSIAKQAQLDDFVKNDLMSALKRGGPEEVDAAISVLTRPGQEAELEHIVRFLSPDDGALTALRRGWLKKALQGVITGSTTGTGTEVRGSVIDAFLSKYTRREQQLLAPNGLDVDLRIVADQLKGLFPKESEAAAMGGSLQAASIKGHVPPIPPTPARIKATYKWLEVAFAGWIANRETLIRAIADIERTPTFGRQMAKNAMSALYRSFVMGATQESQSTAEQRRTGTR